MEFYLLASGSRGNCTIVKTDTTTLMIDCGISKRTITRRLKEFSLDYPNIDGLLITHTHSDHIKYISEHTSLRKYAVFRHDECEEVDFYQSFKINDVIITPIELSHDSGATAGFLIKYHDETLVYITDTGYLSEYNFPYIKNADYYIIESNHDVKMLMDTSRPVYLKKRILGAIGHLSNLDCSLNLVNLVGPNTKEIVLAHISSEANTHQLAFDTLIEVFAEANIDYDKIRITTAKQEGVYKGGNL